MKLTYFSEQTLPKLHRGTMTRSPRIGFGKSGVISFNHSALELIGLKAKDRISLGQDPDHPENWYIFKDKEHGFQLRPGYKNKGLLLNHRLLCDTILDCFDLQKGKTYGFKIGGSSTKIGKDEYWGILITAAVSE